MPSQWDRDATGILTLPSGRRVRGRGLRAPLPGGPHPSFAVYLTSVPPPSPEWDFTWIRWRDFWLPADPDALRSAVSEAWRRSETERVEIACGGGFGRTGTALAALAVVDGVPASDAVAYVRQHYSPRAVEMPWQRRFVTRFSP